MLYRSIGPEEAHKLLEEGEGWVYLDVRTEEEFEAAHVPGAFNLPVAVLDPGCGQLVPNPDFLGVVARHFPPDAKLIVACAAGGRSLHACEFLAAEGYSHVVNMDRGFSGARTADGSYAPGWQALGYQVETSSPLEQTYSHLRG